MRQSRRQLYEINIWPGFVDILGTILIVTIFTVLISTITQIYFNDQLEIKRGEISSLDNKISSLLSEIKAVSDRTVRKWWRTEQYRIPNSYLGLTGEESFSSFFGASGIHVLVHALPAWGFTSCVPVRLTVAIALCESGPDSLACPDSWRLGLQASAPGARPNRSLVDHPHKGPGHPSSANSPV